MVKTNDPALWADALPWPGAETHKHQRGRLGVVCGGPLRTGAARLAARAGLRAGAGLVRLLCPPDAAPIVAGTVEAIMVDAFDGPEALARLTEPMQAVVIGPAAGLEEGTVLNLRAIVAGEAALVVDADALTIFAGRAADLFGLLGEGDVMTPHEGEFDRLFPGVLALGRVAAAVQAAETSGAVVVLKGSRTIIAAPDGRVVVQPPASPWLATAGSGDVLAGLIGGWRAQGMTAFDAACAAVWMHAEAAARFGPGLIAEDLSEQIPAVLRSLR
ncbi:NAD(P)H-hydrate dehydratase [Brevundimonas sp. LM2]|uniref:NAD(P)H-hydrate dehydratase n=1 Tax=Brevundimonas sp. LM2 TaxID=1938605 RepID=UPI000983EDFB|nr:NAD(P)H-hydrate dehydratase [Brevundimonas sp. LM2]AQR62201.1 NAD(P)H-hydrate dehydratase [Brevundimonas sp. LM2]